MSKFFSVVIPSYRRARLLAYALAGLEKQEFRDFETIVVVKPSNDGTEEMVKDFGAELVMQESGNVVTAVNMGFAHAKGEVTVLADSDTHARPDWLLRLFEAYSLKPDAGGVAGLSIECSLESDGRLVPLPTRFTGASLTRGLAKGGVLRNLVKPESSMDVLTTLSPSLAEWVFGGDHESGYAVSISRAGLPVLDRQICAEERASKGGPTLLFPSDLGQGSNLSIRTELGKRIGAPGELKGPTAPFFEQVMAARIREAGYDIFFTPNAAVYHIVSGSGIARDRWGIRSPSFQIKCGTDSALSFFLMRSSSVATRMSSYVLRAIVLETLQPITIGAIVGNAALLFYPVGFMKGTLEGLTLSMNRKKGAARPNPSLLPSSIGRNHGFFNQPKGIL